MSGVEVLADVAEYLRDRSDVIDGPDGQPAPNEEMTLLREVESAIARLRDPAGVGGEWVLVPREPTGTMLQAGVNAGVAARGPWCPKVWSAMLAATPQPPAEALTGDDRILWGVVANAGRLSGNNKYRWSHVIDATGQGSQSSIALCHRFGFDPDERVGGHDDDETDDEAEAQAQGGGESVATVRVTHGGFGMELSTHVAYALPEGTHELFAAAPPSAPVVVEAEPGAVRLLVAAANAVLALYPGDDQLWTLESAVRPFNTTKPDECAVGCPPQQVCDYCQIAALAQQPAAVDGAALTDAAIVAGWEAKAKAHKADDTFEGALKAWQLRDCANELRSRAALADQPGGSAQPQGGA